MNTASSQASQKGMASVRVQGDKDLTKEQGMSQRGKDGTWGSVLCGNLKHFWTLLKNISGEVP